MTSPADRPGLLPPSRLDFRVAPDPTHLLRSRERVRDYLRHHCASEDAVDQVVLAIDEACTNAVRHSGTMEDLEVELGFTDGELVVEVRDHGRGFDTTRFDPRRVPDPLANEGRGLYLMQRLMDDLELRSDEGLVVRMVKRAAYRADLPAASDEIAPHAGGGRGLYWQARQRAMIQEMGEGFAALDWEYRQIGRASCRERV